MIPSSPFRYALLGAGSVGTAVAELLKRAGDEPVAVASRSEASARAAAGRLGVPAGDISSLTAADVILIGAPASAFPTVEAELADVVNPDTVLWHFSGAHGTEPLAATGAQVAAIHPVQACPTVELAMRRLPGSAWGITCTPGLREWAHEVVALRLGGTPVDVEEDDRPIWHAASVVTSNGAAALMASGERILQVIRVDEPQLVLGPLAAGTIQNAVEGGGGAATLTGPVVRGEVETVRRHIEALRAATPDSLDAYLVASRSILETARRAERIDPAVADEMAEVLG